MQVQALDKWGMELIARWGIIYMLNFSIVAVGESWLVSIVFFSSSSRGNLLILIVICFIQE